LCDDRSDCRILTAFGMTRYKLQHRAVLLCLREAFISRE